MKRVLAEALVVGLAGAVLAFAANALSPRGLTISRNYFPAREAGSIAAMTNLADQARAGHASSPVMQRLVASGIALVDSNFVANAFNNPKRTQGLVIFVDAREDAQYKRGHVPGAYQLDFYRPEPHLPIVLPAALSAEQTIIYCNGGDCEDSEFAAVFLRDAGVSPTTLHVYRGGFGEWVTNGLPVEIGARNSGVMHR